MKKNHKKTQPVKKSTYNQLLVQVLDVSRLIPLALTGIFMFWMALVYYRNSVSFLFFDEYANILAGFLLAKGQHLYSDQFFNHQMLPVYLSYLVQKILHPNSLYNLLLYHRLIIILFSWAMALVLTWRLRWAGLIFVVLYEGTKYYLFGNLFLAESITVYLHVYLGYLVWLRGNGKNLSVIDLIVAALSTWFILFSREPYVPLALFLYILIIFSRKLQRPQIYSIGLLVVFSLITLAFTPLREYIYQVIYVNYQTVFKHQLESSAANGLGVFAMFFYPILTFFKGVNSPLRVIEILVSILFIIQVSLYIGRTKKYLHGIVILMILGLANVRMNVPGLVFYGAFYTIQWFGLLASITSILFIHNLKITSKLAKILSLVILAITMGYVLGNPKSFIWESVEKNKIFAYHYDQFYISGEAIKILARPDSTLFVDQSDSLLFWTANIDSSYKRVVFYPVMNEIPMYMKEREEMFRNTPPDFYFVNCLEKVKRFTSMPREITSQYAPIKFNNTPTCFFVHKRLTHNLSQERIDKLSQLRFSIAPEFIKNN